ncbi:MAG: Sporulation protein [Gemmatimonadetes bacterium]|nr:Sporulation protein [Gemmatimonadota bacterium]
MNRPMNWVQEGREVGVTLDACHAVVVVGSDPVATAEVALGIARVQAQHRRVAVADMFGDAPPLQALVPSDDPHGLVDSFLYGVSLNRIAYQVPDAGELFVIPSGTGPLDYEELFAHPRWRKLAAGFGEMGALLLIAAPAEAPRIRELVDATDGAVLVGDTVPANLPVAVSLAWLRTRRSAPMSVAMSLPAAQGRPTGIEEVVLAPRWRRWAGPAGGIAAAIVLALLGYWFAIRPLVGGPAKGHGVSAESPAAAVVTHGALTADGGTVMTPVPARADSAAAGGTAPLAAAGTSADSFPQLRVVNPQDSAAAASFAVFLGETSTKSGAILHLEQSFRTVPVATYGVKPRSLFFLLFTGAYQTRTEADSLLAALRQRRVLGPAAGVVMSVPYAFLVQSNVPPAEAPARVARYRAGGHPVYALRQADGTMQLYFGAYATPQQAALAIPAVRDAKLTPTLVYRIGRTQ